MSSAAVFLYIKIRTKKKTRTKRFRSCGGDEGDRTPYLLHAMQALSQVSYTPTLAHRTYFRRLAYYSNPSGKCQGFFWKKFYRFSDYLFISPQMLERLVISSISGILRFGRHPAYHGISEPHLALKSSKTVVETRSYYYAANLSIAAFAEA